MDSAVAIPPSEELLSLEDVKTFIRTIGTDTTEDEAVLEPLITAAREYCENFTGRSLAPQTVIAYPSVFETVMVLPRPPIVKVLELRYTDDTGKVTSVDKDDYVVNTLEGTVTMLKIPSFKPYPASPIEIEYEAGYTEDTLPKTIRQANLMLITHWYDNREAVAFGSRFNLVEVGLVPTLLRQYKVWWF